MKYLKYILILTIFFSCEENENYNGQVIETVNTSKIFYYNGLVSNNNYFVGVMENQKPFGSPKSDNGKFLTNTFFKTNNLNPTYFNLMSNVNLSYRIFPMVGNEVYNTIERHSFGSNFTSGKSYSLFSAGYYLSNTNNNFKGLALEDDLTLPNTGKAKIRVVNIVTRADSTPYYAVDVVFTNNHDNSTQTLLNVQPLSGSGYLIIDTPEFLHNAGTPLSTTDDYYDVYGYTVNVYIAGTTTQIASLNPTSSSSKFKQGKIYNIILSGLTPNTVNVSGNLKANVLEMR